MESLPLTFDNLNPMVKKLQFAVRGATVIRAGEIEKELAQVSVKSAQLKANILNSNKSSNSHIKK